MQSAVQRSWFWLPSAANENIWLSIGVLGLTWMFPNTSWSKARCKSPWQWQKGKYLIGKNFHMRPLSSLLHKSQTMSLADSVLASESSCLFGNGVIPWPRWSWCHPIGITCFTCSTCSRIMGRSCRSLFATLTYFTASTGSTGYTTIACYGALTSLCHIFRVERTQWLSSLLQSGVHSCWKLYSSARNLLLAKNLRSSVTIRPPFIWG